MVLIDRNEARQLLNQSGVSQRKVSERTGVSESYLSQWLCGKRILETQSLINLTGYFEMVSAIA